ncbi:phosphatidylinositol-glycan biosynthesis class S protein-domain-containing protein [Cyathus striatus]|nr:phosphatidylinositol-glycan biosynthesis class S protein-domain-containing protein [Cyathus striatus]
MSSAPSTKSPSVHDPSKLSYQSHSVRRSIILSYWIVIFLSLPLWWYTTSITRLSLPASWVSSHAERRLRLPVRICLPSESNASRKTLQRAIDEHVMNSQGRWEGLDVEIDICTKPLTEYVYSLAFEGREVAVEGRKLFYPNFVYKAISKLAEVLSTLLTPHSVAPDQRVAQYAPSFRLAFSLLNEDAAAGYTINSWDIKEGLEKHIFPIISPLSSLHKFTIESQVQFHAPLAFHPQLINSTYALTQEDLTVFVNSAEWTLSSSASNDPVLHFILFIPSAYRQPLLLVNSDGQPLSSSAFLLPQWGGIFVHNPNLKDTSKNTGLPTSDLDHIFSVFANQLSTLLGVPRLPPGVKSTDTNRRITDWQLDTLIRRRALENAEGSQNTLRSIVKLVNQIENMPVGEDVKGDIYNALNALDQMHVSAGVSLHDTFRHSAEAFMFSSRAFFNPGMLALLYFPAEHKYAVYAPLFASVMVPLFITTLREAKAWRRQRQEAMQSTNST